MIGDPFRIVAVDPLPQKLQDIFHEQIPSGEYRFQCPESSREEEAESLAGNAGALVTRHRLVDPKLISKAAKSLKLIQVMGRLPDRVDLSAAHNAGVPVAVMPHGGAIAVAEHAMAMMLALARRVLPGHQGVVDAGYRKRGLQPAITSEWRFSFNWLAFTDVTELIGKTLGLIGLGEIGREVARRARAFDMRLLYHQRHSIPEPYEKILGVSYVPLERLLRESDFVSLHVPHTPQTERLLDEKNLALLKPTAYLINTARGGVVDEKALVEHLRERRMAGAGLDVFVEEPLSVDHPFLGLDNVVLAPHTGGGSGGGHRKNIAEIVDNIVRVARGERPHHLVEPEI